MPRAEVKSETPLTVAVVDGELVIRIGVNVLASAVAHGDAFHDYDDQRDVYFRPFAIKDPTAFAKDVGLMLEREDEDGSSPLSDLLDEAAQAAIDDGSTAVKHGVRIPFEEGHRSENWHPKSKQK